MGVGLVSGMPVATDESLNDQAATTDEVLIETEGAASNEVGFEEIPETYQKVYFEKKPDGFLIDPQRILSPVVRRDRLAFLEYHAGDSNIDLYVYLLRGDQKVPTALACEKLMENHFSDGKAAAVVMYPFGSPDRSVCYLSSGLVGVVPDAENKRALASSIMQAVEKTDPAGQLEAFLVQMSIRLYWMEKVVGKEDAGDVRDADVIVVTNKEVVEEQVGIAEKLEPLYAVVKEWAWEAGAAAGVVVLLSGVMVWSRFRARHVLPDFSVEPRLGGEHGAGVGAVISFANASVPPASQRGRSD